MAGYLALTASPRPIKESLDSLFFLHWSADFFLGGLAALAAASFFSSPPTPLLRFSHVSHLNIIWTCQTCPHHTLPRPCPALLDLPSSELPVLCEPRRSKPFLCPLPANCPVTLAGNPGANHSGRCHYGGILCQILHTRSRPPTRARQNHHTPITPDHLAHAPSPSSPPEQPDKAGLQTHASPCCFCRCAQMSSPCRARVASRKLAHPSPR